MTVVAVPPAATGSRRAAEVLDEAVRVLQSTPAARTFSWWCCRSAAPAIDETRRPAAGGDARSLPLGARRPAGAVGGPKWDGGPVRPEAGLLGLRKALDVYANLRPATLGDVDLLIVRELVGGLYFGERGVRADGTVSTRASTTRRRSSASCGGASSSRRAPRLAVSVDKANVLDTSRLWRRVVDQVAADYPGVELRHALVDSFAMELVTSADRFDVAVTENTFGDILSDVAAAVTGGSASPRPRASATAGPGIFEPVHGSAPDIAGTGHANPTAMLRSLALMLEHGFGRADLARDRSTRRSTTRSGHTPTPDAGGSATTVEFGDAVLASLEQRVVV